MTGDNMELNNVTDRIMVGLLGFFGSIIFLMIRRIYGPIFPTTNATEWIDLVINGLFIPLVVYAILVFSLFLLFTAFAELFKRLLKRV
jgi:hypothetical protein